MKRKIKWRNVVLLCIMLFFIVLLIISIINIINWKKDNNNIDDLVNNLQDSTIVEDVNDGETIEQEEPVDKNSPYWDYIKMNLINVKFDELKKTNDHVRGWIQVNGTNINYPFVQADDNEFYLTHSFDKSKNKAGWVFMDFRNNISTMDKNTIIYAHSRMDQTMFGTLKQAITDKWLNNPNNFVVKLSTENENTLWQVFSIYTIPTTSDYLQVNFTTNTEFKDFTNMLINRSIHDFNTSVGVNDKILTLSTCYHQTQKVVLHAKLIKKEAR